MMKDCTPPKRTRGFILTTSGYQRIQKAQHQARLINNRGAAYTLEELAKQTSLSQNTVLKIQQRKIAVDRSSLAIYFNAFGLILQSDDYMRTPALYTNYDLISSSGVDQTGSILFSPKFYIKRHPIEERCDNEIAKPGGLVLIKAPKRMGKTSLTIQILNRVRQRGWKTLFLNMRLADISFGDDVNKFLSRFCAIVTHNLGLPNKVSSYWDDMFGSNYNCTCYFEQYLLKQTDQPVILALDDVEVLFQYPAIAQNFFGILRAWYEKAQYGDEASKIWQNLRFIIVYSSDAAVPINIHQSPFNVGFSIELTEFTPEQTLMMIQQYGLNWSSEQVRYLANFIGGHPFLLQKALSQIQYQQLTFEQFIETTQPGSTSVVIPFTGASCFNRDKA
ncbi:MAG: AAA-like domain-containing protein [Elainella sp. C42_A2020_010]|nr:AAA-like domain-containing protein [Elainella sp. C42_A2020_010]